MHKRTAKKQSTAARPRAQCGTTSCAATPVGAVELSRRRVPTTAGHGSVGRKCSPAGKHGRTASTAVTRARQRHSRVSASVGAAPSIVRLSRLRRRTTSSCDRLATRRLCAAATPTNTDRSSVWLRGSAAQRRHVSASQQSTPLAAACVQFLTVRANACDSCSKCSDATPVLPSENGEAERDTGR